MKCSPVNISGQPMIVCGRNRIAICRCGTPVAVLCDWKLGPGRTCDRGCCAGCAVHVGDDKDLCPEHGETWASDPRNPKRKTQPPGDAPATIPPQALP